MARYDYDHDKVFGVVESFDENGCTRFAPQIIKKPLQFIDKLIEGANFESVFVQTERQNFTFFPTLELAEDFLDEISNTNH